MLSVWLRCGPPSLTLPWWVGLAPAFQPFLLLYGPALTQRRAKPRCTTELSDGRGTEPTVGPATWTGRAPGGGWTDGLRWAMGRWAVRGSGGQWWIAGGRCPCTATPVSSVNERLRHSLQRRILPSPQGSRTLLDLPRALVSAYHSLLG